MSAKERMNRAADVIRDVNKAESMADLLERMEREKAEYERAREARRTAQSEADRRNISRMATWRYPRGSLSREMLDLMKRVEAPETEVRGLRQRLDERDNREWTEAVERSEWPSDERVSPTEGDTWAAFDDP